VVNVVNTQNPCGSNYGHLIEDIKEGLQKLSSTRFIHVRRNANTVAHTLAVEARTHVMGTTRWNFLPPSICVIVR
jgi:hypothetical protein